MGDRIGTTRRAARSTGEETPPSVFRRKSCLDDGWDDARLKRAIASAQAGDLEGIRFLYSRFADNVYGYVQSIVRDSYEAEDVTQHVFVKMMSVIGKYDRRGGPFAAWMLRVARNVAIDHVRQRQAIPVEEVFSSEEESTESATASPLWDALAALTEEQREVVVLRHFGGLSPQEIAGRLGKTEASVHGLHHRGRAVLQRELLHLGSAPAVLGGGRAERLAASPA